MEATPSVLRDLPGVTEKQLVQVTLEWSGFVIFTAYAPVIALAGTLIVALSVVEVTTIDPLTALTDGEWPVKVIVAPGSKPLPWNVTLVLVPAARDGGLALVSVGRAVIVRHPAQVTEPLGSVTVTSLAPRDAWAFTLTPMVTAADATLTSVGLTPPPEMVTLRGETKPVPPITRLDIFDPCTRWLGVTEAIVRALGTTALDGADAGPVPAELVAVTEKV
jgi:hypothetical protein